MSGGGGKRETEIARITATQRGRITKLHATSRFFYGFTREDSKQFLMLTLFCTLITLSACLLFDCMFCLLVCVLAIVRGNDSIAFGKCSSFRSSRKTLPRPCCAVSKPIDKMICKMHQTKQKPECRCTLFLRLLLLLRPPLVYAHLPTFPSLISRPTTCWHRACIYKMSSWAHPPTEFASGRRMPPCCHNTGKLRWYDSRLPKHLPHRGHHPPLSASASWSY